MTELEKIELDHIRHLLIDAEIHFIKCNHETLSDSQKDNEFSDGAAKLKTAIELLSKVVYDGV